VTGSNGAEGGHDGEEKPVEQVVGALVGIRAYTEEELRAAESELQELTAADWKLISVFGDTIHQNNGTHLHGGASAAVDTAWQRRWMHVIANPHSLYSLSRANGS